MTLILASNFLKSSILHSVRFTNFWQTVSEVRLKFPKFATNLAFSLRSCQWNRELRNEVVNFTPNFVGEVAKLVASEVRVIRLVYDYKWIQTNWKKFSTKQGLLYDVHFWNVKYLRGTEWLHITDGWRELRLVYSRNVNTKVQQHDIGNVLGFFCSISRMTHVLKKCSFNL